jgi:hypothetical protein
MKTFILTNVLTAVGMGLLTLIMMTVAFLQQILG